MVFFNHATRQMTAKIVYYGPGLCGKTTNLNTIYGKTSQKARGEMVSLNTETDRTLFFDLLPMDVGVIGGFKAKLQLYTVPGQVFYNSTRKLVLKGVDGIVFVADSQTPMLDANKESLQNLDANLRELGIDLREIPMVFQWNKRDLKNIVSVDELEQELNLRHLPSFHSVAQDGTGVFETLRGITKLALSHIKSHHFNEPEAPRKAAVALQSSDLFSEQSDDQFGEPESLATQPTPAEPLSFSDLPSVGDLLMDIPSVAKPPAPAVKPVRPSVLPRPSAPIPVLRPNTPVRTTVSPMMVSLAPPHALKPRSVTAPKATAGAIIGDLSMLSLPGPGVLKIGLPASVDASELEVIVQIRQKDQIIAEGQIKKPVPGKGSITKISVELKRS